MSGTASRARGIPQPAPLQLPRVAFAPVAAPVNAAFSQIEQADRQNVKRGQEISVPSILLAAPNGATFRVTIDLTGAVPALALAPV
jgi:hypothetical protein